MKLVDPVAVPAVTPPQRNLVPKPKRRKPRRISPPLSLPEPNAADRVITQGSKPDSDFVVPLPQPEEAVQKTIDPAEAQHGSDEADAVTQEQIPAAEPDKPLLAEGDIETEQARMKAQQEADEERLAAALQEQELQAQKRLAQEMAERKKSDELLAQQRSAQELADRQQAVQVLAQQRQAQEVLERKKAEELLFQQRQEQERVLAQQRRDDELLERKKA
ncbi:MAG TPA: hypothetical protein VGD30_14950, partial [Telluria sp.]